MEVDWADSRSCFDEAAGWFVASVALVGDRWAEPGLGEWDIRALVGHTSRSLLTVEQYLARPAERVDVGSVAAYYAATREVAAAPDVAQRGRDAGTALGADPASGVAEIARRVIGVVGASDGTELVATIAGGMRLADYLPTRTFELVVHTLDLAAALGMASQPPTRAATQALHLVTDLAVAEGRAGQLLLAATGRVALTPGFTVL